MSITRPPELSGLPASSPPPSSPQPSARQPGRRHANSAHASKSVPGPSIWLRWLLPIRLGAVLVWEAAGIAVLISYAHRNDSTGRPIFWAVAGLAALILLLSSVRVAGLTGLERFRVAITLRRRRKRYATDAVDDTVQNRLLPGLTLNTHIDRAGNRTGVIGTGLGWSAAIRIADTSSPDPEALIAAATRACLRPDLPLAAAQVLSWNVPSTWEGSQGTLRQFFLSVRTAERPSRRAIRARGGGPAGAQRATASAAASLAFELTRLGYACTVLDSSELEQHVQLMSGATTQAVPADQAAKPLETKDTWAVGQVQQSCFRVGGGTTRSDALLWPAKPPLSFAVGSCTIRPNGDREPTLTFLMRAAMVRQQSSITIEQASRALDRRLVPLRFRQESALQATLPLALGDR